MTSTLRLPLVLACAIALPIASLAAPIPIEVSHGGYLLDAADRPVNATGLGFSFSIWNDATATAPANRTWPATPNACTLDVASGYFAVTLGAGCAPGLDSAALPAGVARWLEVTVAGVTLSPRTRLSGVASAATASRALDAERLGGELPAAFHDASLLTGSVPLAALPGVLTSVTASAPLTVTPSANGAAIAMTAADAGADGYLRKEDFASFAGKLGVVTLGVNSGLTGAGTPASPLALAAGGSAYIQNGTSAQSASLNITGTAQIGGLVTLGANLQLGQKQLLGARFENLPAEPACDANRKGYVYFNTTDNRFWGCNGAAFVALESTVGGAAVSTSTKTPVDITTASMTWTLDSLYGGTIASAGNPANAGDHVNKTNSGAWQSQCTQSTSVQGVHWLKVDLGSARTITSFGIAGHAGGSHKPSTSFSLQGSNDDATWTSVWTGGTDLWTADSNGSYPPRNTQTVTTPGAYRWYRVYSTSWTNGYLLVCNLALYELQAGPTSGDAMQPGFGFSADSFWNVSYGGPAMVADRVNITAAAPWATTCHQSGSTQGPHWVKVDYLEGKRIRSFGVSGYPGGNYKPTSLFYLQASNDDATWTTLWSGDTANWPADTAGTSPPRFTLNIPTPGTYRWYRIFSNDWSNAYLLLCDWAMYY